ncbi:MAG: hypothetical protein GY731_03400, partial [Gammaproteobacteria bacterium]|nr:hypothetical protein [Gammaproteobacteria bacterium]
LDIPPGLSMLTAHELNDLKSPRIRSYLHLFRQARVPDPAEGDWSAWKKLLSDRCYTEGDGPHGAMNVEAPDGFGTLSSTFIALPSSMVNDGKPMWIFSAGAPDRMPFEPVL